jgi:drug/metabolite transporter (DMT)-like permease
MKSYLLLLITVIIYSGNLLVGKAISHLSPQTVTFFRFLIAFIVILPFARLELRAKREMFLKNWKPLVGMSFTGIIIFNFLVYLSLNFTTSTNAGIVESTTPIFTIMLGFFALKERLRVIQVLGMILSFIGAFWVITKGSWEIISQLQINIGDFYMLLAVIMWSIYTILVKQHNHKFPAYGSLAIMMAVGLIVLFPFALMDWLSGNGVTFTFSTVLGLLYLGVFPSIIALMFWNKAVADIGASKASIFLNLLPVFTTVGAVIFLKEKVILAQVFGGLLVITGVLITTKRKKAKSPSTKVEGEMQA